MIGPHSQQKMRDLAEWLVRTGRSAGADEIEAGISEGREFSLDVRHGEIENLIETGSRSAGFRLFVEGRTASASSSDLSKPILRRLVESAVERARLTHRDECAGLPTEPEVSADPDDLRLYDPSIPKMTSDEKIWMARETERIALADSRITNSHGAGLETREIRTTLALSNGFVGQYAETFCSLSVGLQAGDTDDRVEESWGCTRRHLGEMETPEEVARRAVERTVRQLKPRRIQTRNVPVIFEPPMTTWLLGFLFSCVSGSSVYQKTTFLAESLGKRIGNDLITVIDDGRLPGKLGTTPFDSEGIPTRRNLIVENGVLRLFPCNTYAARKMGSASTGNAEGSGVGPTNFYMERGRTPVKDILRGMKRGLILTGVLGHGLNPVTGDISRGAFGLWVENGEVAFPVSEITISGNLGRILREIEKVGDDLDFRNSISGPTVQVAEMTLAGRAG